MVFRHTSYLVNITLYDDAIVLVLFSTKSVDQKHTFAHGFVFSFFFCKSSFALNSINWQLQKYANSIEPLNRQSQQTITYNNHHLQSTWYGLCSILCCNFSIHTESVSVGRCVVRMAHAHSAMER